MRKILIFYHTSVFYLVSFRNFHSNFLITQDFQPSNAVKWWGRRERDINCFSKLPFANFPFGTIGGHFRPIGQGPPRFHFKLLLPWTQAMRHKRLKGFHFCFQWNIYCHPNYFVNGQLNTRPKVAFTQSLLSTLKAMTSLFIGMEILYTHKSIYTIIQAYGNLCISGIS